MPDADHTMHSTDDDLPRPAAGRRWLLLLASFPTAYFVGALATDVAYASSADMMWADFSAWLLAAGILMAVLAALVGIVVLLVNRGARRPRPGWPLVLGSVVVLALAFLDNLVHTRDAWTSVVPLGLALSAATVVAVLVTAWFGYAARTPRAAYAGIAGR